MSETITPESLHVTIKSFEVIEQENQKYSSADVRNSATGVVVDTRHHNITKLFLTFLAKFQF